MQFPSKNVFIKYLLKTLILLVLSLIFILALPATITHAGVNSSSIQSGQAIISINRWQKKNDNWYYYINGIKQTGWIHPNSWYYMNNDGVMQTGLIEIDEKWYYFNNSGVMQTGWCYIDNNWYYFDSSGIMQTGWVQSNNDSNKFYYLKSNGKMAIDEVVENKYYIDSNGIWYDTDAQKLIDTACQQLGKDYLYATEGPDTFDCSGFVQYCYKKSLKIYLPRTTYELIEEGSSVYKDELQPGDLVFPHTGHVQIYIGNGKIIHCPHSNDVVKISELGDIYEARRIL